MNKTRFFSLILAVYLTSPGAQAYTFKEDNKPISSSKVLQEAVEIGLTPHRPEIEAKREIRTWTDRTVKREMESGAPETLLMEVKKERAGLEDAKVIARHQLFKAVEKHWNRIKDSSLNESAADSFAKYQPYLKRELDKIEYIDTKDSRAYLFTLPWADVRVDKKLKKVSFVIRIGSHLDRNRLEPGADKIIVPERSAE